MGNLFAPKSLNLMEPLSPTRPKYYGILNLYSFLYMINGSAALGNDNLSLAASLALNPQEELPPVEVVEEHPTCHYRPQFDGKGFPGPQ